MWLALYPHMTEKTFVSFDKFKDDSTRKRKPKKQTTADMIAMCKLLNAAFGGEVIEV